MIKAVPKPAENPAVALARKVLSVEADAVRALIDRVDERFLAALTLILERRGRVVVSGMGKSGHIARKIASTLSSTGTPAYFVHPAEASHGDLGMIESGDVFIAISHSGSSHELLEIVPQVKRRGAKLIAITGKLDSPLARDADVTLDARVEKEACPHNLAPTASTTAALALGDALAVALLDARGFSAADFAHVHPRGGLPDQARLQHAALLRVKDVMRGEAKVPKVASGSTLRQALAEMTRGGIGMTAVVDAAGGIRGIFTDGDLRRTLERSNDLEQPVDPVMTAAPKTIRPDLLAAEAVHLMEQHKINQLLVVDGRGTLIGALNMHDLFRAKVL